MTANRGIDFIGAALLGAALLLPVGDAPWFSFWREWVAAVAVLLILLGAVSRLRRRGEVVRIAAASLPTAAFLLAAVPWLQWLGGIESYRGDAFLASAYLAAFALCIAVARSLDAPERVALADRLAAAMLFAAACSVPLALLQWLGWLRLDLGMKVAAGRPVAHMEQTNLLCSLLIQGLLGAWRLRQRRLLGPVPFGVLACGLLLTADLTQSRVLWLVLGATGAAILWRRKALDLQGSRISWMAAAIIVAIGTLALPWIDARLDLTGLTLADRVTGGRRPDVWRLFLDASFVHPWAGWGALQNGSAQFTMAATHPPLLWCFSSAHDVVLDLMVWFGIPIGATAGIALIGAAILCLRRATDAASFATALAIAALLLHGLVELPLQYAFFLLPLGLMIGCIGGVEPRGRRAWRLPVEGSAGFATLALVPALFLALLARDYIPLSDTRPVLLLDRAANHASLNAAADIPDALLLDQLQAYHAFAAHPVASGLAPDVVQGLRKPMLRFPFAPAQELYAHLVALNGDPALALDALQRSCTFMTKRQCDESRGAWAYWRGKGEPLPAWPDQP